MTDNEVNKIIAKFMGYKVLEVDAFDIKIHNAEKSLVRYIALYTKSLDELVPVWEKLEKYFIIEINRNDIKNYYRLTYPRIKIDGLEIDEMPIKGTIQQSAAIATAKAIQEIGEA